MFLHTRSIPQLRKSCPFSAAEPSSPKVPFIDRYMVQTFSLCTSRRYGWRLVRDSCTLLDLIKA